MNSDENYILGVACQGKADELKELVLEAKVNGASEKVIDELTKQAEAFEARANDFNNAYLVSLEKEKAEFSKKFSVPVGYYYIFNGRFIENVTTVKMALTDDENAKLIVSDETSAKQALAYIQNHFEGECTLHECEIPFNYKNVK